MLVAIAIPIFTTQLEKSRESTDASNIRAAYAEVSALALTDPDQDHSASVALKQKTADWQNTGIEDIAGVTTSDIASSGNVEVKYTASSGKITIDGKEVKASFVS